MKKPTVLACLMLLAAGVAARADDNPNAAFDAKRLNRELPGTWESRSLGDAPRQIVHIKHLTPTHFTWVTYDRDQQQILAVAGGTWSLRDGKYVEVCDFASGAHLHLSGKTNAFTTHLDRDKWDIKGLWDTGSEIDEVWTRIKPENHQTKNTAEPAQRLLGSWESAQPSDAPKAVRMVKHVTPTHWTWVTYDRENRMVLTSAGGTWSLRNGAYVEDCEFTTDNLPQARGNSNAFEFRIDGDRWILKWGNNRAVRDDETWTRLRKPSP
jgi:hypothetical protein